MGRWGWRHGVHGLACGCRLEVAVPAVVFEGRGGPDGEMHAQSPYDSGTHRLPAWKTLDALPVTGQPTVGTPVLNIGRPV